MQSLYWILEPRQVGNTECRQSTQIMFLYQMMIIMMIFGKHQNRTISLITQQQRVDLSFRSVVPKNLRFSLVDRKSKMIMFKRWQRITEYATFWKKGPFVNKFLFACTNCTYTKLNHQFHLFHGFCCFFLFSHVISPLR